MNSTYLTNKQERENTKQHTSSMSTCRPHDLQLPLRPRTLLITDVTRLQPFTAGGDNFRENIETLVSYNIHTDGLQQDCLYIEQGHLMTPTTFMTYLMAIDPQNSRSNMDSNTNVLYAAGLPALISTGITLIYFFLKTCLIPQNQREAGSGHAR